MHTICSALKIYKQQNKKIKVILKYIIQGLPGLEESLSLGKEKKRHLYIHMYVRMYEHYLHEFSEGEGNPSGPWTESWTNRV